MITAFKKWFLSDTVRSFTFYMVLSVVASVIISLFGFVLDTQECFYYRSIDYKSTYLKMIDVKAVVREDLAGVIDNFRAKVGIVVVYDEEDTILPFLVYSRIDNQFIKRSLRGIRGEVLSSRGNESNIYLFSYFEKASDTNLVEPLDASNPTYFNIYQSNLEDECYSFSFSDKSHIRGFDRLLTTIVNYEADSLVACPVTKRVRFYGKDYVNLMGSVLVFFDHDDNNLPINYVVARTRLFTASIAKLWNLSS